MPLWSLRLCLQVLFIIGYIRTWRLERIGESSSWDVFEWELSITMLPAPSETFKLLLDTRRRFRRRYHWWRKTAHQQQIKSSPRIAAARIRSQNQFTYHGTENGANMRTLKVNCFIKVVHFNINLKQINTVYFNFICQE